MLVQSLCASSLMPGTLTAAASLLLRIAQPQRAAGRPSQRLGTFCPAFASSWRSLPSRSALAARAVSSAVAPAANMAGLPSAADHKIAADLLEFLNEGVTEFHAGVLAATLRPPLPCALGSRPCLARLSSACAACSGCRRAAPQGGRVCGAVGAAGLGGRAEGRPLLLHAQRLDAGCVCGGAAIRARQWFHDGGSPHRQVSCTCKGA